MTEKEALEMVPATRREISRTANRVGKSKRQKEGCKCLVASCASRAAFPANRERRNHLRGVHDWTHDEAMEAVPLSKAEAGRAKARADQAAKEEEIEKGTKTTKDVPKPVQKRQRKV
jgi:hypothetical protein